MLVSWICIVISGSFSSQMKSRMPEQGISLLARSLHGHSRAKKICLICVNRLLTYKNRSPNSCQATAEYFPGSCLMFWIPVYQSLAIWIRNMPLLLCLSLVQISHVLLLSFPLDLASLVGFRLDPISHVPSLTESGLKAGAGFICKVQTMPRLPFVAASCMSGSCDWSPIYARSYISSMSTKAIVEFSNDKRRISYICSSNDIGSRLYNRFMLVRIFCLLCRAISGISTSGRMLMKQFIGMQPKLMTKLSHARLLSVSATQNRAPAFPQQDTGGIILASALITVADL